jgi:glucosamine--fructose-6-phosphate aminotransferase (isomerizing)
VLSRGAYTIIITDNPAMCEHISDEMIPIPNSGLMTALLALSMIQLIAYELALKKGINPDVPKAGQGRDCGLKIIIL